VIKLNKVKIINSLKINGFTEYEAKVYIALLEGHPANGNMVALSSGVPGPKVYETLRRMQEKGYVYVVSPGDKSNRNRYSPIPHQDLLSSLEGDFQVNFKILKKEFEEIANFGDLEWMDLFHIDGYEPSIQAIKEKIRSAKEQILLSGWSKNVLNIYENLINAHESGVDVITIIFDEFPMEIPWNNTKHFSFGYSDSKHAGELNLVIDSNKTIILESLPDSKYAVVSSHQSLVKSTMNYIRHDIYLNQVIGDFGDLLKGKYGGNLEELIDW
jgi:sugar-specific transcriptional regulator TrmB